MKVFRLGLGNGLHLSVAAVSDVGMVRQNNEDSLGVFPEPGEGVGHLLVVADGMGGAAAGEVASRMTVDALTEVVRAAKPGEAPVEILGRALAMANHRVLDQSLTDREQRGMGTTCTAVLVRGNLLHVAHIGDSRAYRMDGEDLRQLTLDHTLGAELERNQLPGGPAAPPESHNILTRCIGVDARLQADFLEEAAPGPGGMLLLCSDGLTGVVPDDTIARILLEGDPPDAARDLVAEAKDGGAPDNVSVIVARVERS